MYLKQTLNEFLGNIGTIFKTTGDSTKDGFFGTIYFRTWMSDSNNFDYHREDEFVEDVLDDICDFLEKCGLENVDWSNLVYDSVSDMFVVDIGGNYDDLTSLYLSLNKNDSAILYALANDYEKGRYFVTVFHTFMSNAAATRLKKLGFIDYHVNKDFWDKPVYELELKPLLAEAVRAYKNNVVWFR